MRAAASHAIPLAILDPALGRTGAHNRGFAEMMAARTEGALAFWCSTSIDDEYRSALAARGAAAYPTFSRDFYGLVHEPGGVAEHWAWIYAFAQDYVVALREVVERWPGTRVRVLHHTLSWEHASALAIAIRQLGEAGRFLEHVALLMYSPGVDADGAVLDSVRRLNFRLAFSALSDLWNVSLYAACGEYAAAYANLLDTTVPLPLHPCFLGDWRQRPAREEAPQDCILAYVGEIKQEKGFIDLPERLAGMLSDPACNHQRFVVQVTEARTPTAHEIMGRLRDMSAADARIDLHEGYWSDDELQYWFSHADAVCLDYDAKAYSHKSSGLLWLAAWHDLPVRVPIGSWLDREARRLGIPRIPSGRLPLVKFAQRGAVGADPEYFRALFTPFYEWIHSRPGGSGEAEASIAEGGVSCGDTAGEVEAEIREALEKSNALAGLPAISGGNGVDIVLFWKQNDSTLYGRRNDMVARYLASRDDVRKVMVVDAPVSDARLMELAAGDGIDQQRWIYTRTLEKLQGLHDSDVVAHRVFVYPSTRFAKDAHEQAGVEFIDAYAEFLTKKFERESIDTGQAVFWIYPRDFCMPALLQRFRPARIVVDVVDDHRAWPGVSAGDKARFSGNYRELLGAADLALANCEAVRSGMREYHDDIKLVPNGCDEQPVAPSNPAPSGLLAEIDAHPGKVIGFVGNLEPKIDIELLDEVAQKFPQHLLVLVGSTHANPGVRALLRHPNVRLPGVVPYDQIGAWLSRFDVGLIPHLDIELTRRMNPLKTHVYLGWGVPVVSTAVANVQADGELVRMADSHRAFLQQVEAALESPPFDPEQLREYAAANGWGARLATHVDSLALGAL